jgi:hypothetical protein
MSIWKVGLATIFVGIFWLSTEQTAARAGVRIGTLNCDVQGGVGLILGSRRNMNCNFRPTSGRSERYTGRITRVGIDIGVTGRAHVTWAVVAPGRLAAGSLAGSYGGVSAKATVGVGLGANVLVGGFKKTVALQPLSVQTQTGLNIAAGIAGLRLRYSGN